MRRIGRERESAERWVNARREKSSAVEKTGWEMKRAGIRKQGRAAEKSEGEKSDGRKILSAAEKSVRIILISFLLFNGNSRYC